MELEKAYGWDRAVGSDRWGCLGFLIGGERSPNELSAVIALPLSLGPALSWRFDPSIVPPRAQARPSEFAGQPCRNVVGGASSRPARHDLRRRLRVLPVLDRAVAPVDASAGGVRALSSCLGRGTLPRSFSCRLRDGGSIGGAGWPGVSWRGGGVSIAGKSAHPRVVDPDLSCDSGFREIERDGISVCCRPSPDVFAPQSLAVGRPPGTAALRTHHCPAGSGVGFDLPDGVRFSLGADPRLGGRARNSARRRIHEIGRRLFRSNGNRHRPLRPAADARVARGGQWGFAHLLFTRSSVFTPGGDRSRRSDNARGLLAFLPHIGRARTRFPQLSMGRAAARGGPAGRVDCAVVPSLGAWQHLPAAAGHPARALAALPVDARIGRGEVAERRPRVAQFFGAAISFRDSAAAALAELARASTAHLAAQGRHARHVRRRVARAVSDLRATAVATLRGCCHRNPPGRHHHHRQLRLLQLADAGALSRAVG